MTECIRIVGEMWLNRFRLYCHRCFVRCIRFMTSFPPERSLDLFRAIEIERSGRMKRPDTIRVHVLNHCLPGIHLSLHFDRFTT